MLTENHTNSSTEDTQNIPKVYWIGGRGPTTCAIHVDVNPEELLAVETFRVRSVGLAAERIVSRCLVRERKTGLDYPGTAEHVYARIVRTDAPFDIDLVENSDVQSVPLLNGTGILRSVTVSAGGVIGIGSNGTSISVA